MKTAAFLGLAMLASCNSSEGYEGSAWRRTSEIELQSLSQLASKAAPGASVLASCGASSGQSFYVAPEEMKWDKDGIKGGRFVFLKRPSGETDYLFLDAGEQFLSARDDGGEVRILEHSGDKGDFTAIVSYSQTGVVETFVITEDAQRKRIALMTVAKPALGLPARTSSFVADCI